MHGLRVATHAHVWEDNSVLESLLEPEEKKHGCQVLNRAQELDLGVIILTPWAD